MFYLRKPAAERMRGAVAAQAGLPFTYAAVGATAQTPPVGYVVDRTRVLLGCGAGAFQAARAALERWEQFRLGWVEAVPADTPLQSGRVVAVAAQALGVWSLNVCRIVYVIDEPRRFGFAYGTLPGHIESGEERFQIEWQEDDRVWYDILAFSRPRHPLARLGYPFIRRLQKRFGRDSAAAMAAAVAPSTREVR